MAWKEGQFDVVELMASDQRKTFGINLNAQHVNGMTPFDIRLLDTLSINIKCSCAFLHYNCAVCCKGNGPSWWLDDSVEKSTPVIKLVFATLSLF